jgi:NAD(P)-dependent dehydrogenase (short-subunit alcohol dehydrogenase family)
LRQVDANRAALPVATVNVDALAVSRRRVVNMIADIWNGWPYYAHSASARGGMWTLTESAASEWACRGVRVNAVAPGGIASSGLDTYEPEAPMQRFGNASEISSAAWPIIRR